MRGEERQGNEEKGEKEELAIRIMSNRTPDLSVYTRGRDRQQ